MQRTGKFDRRNLNHTEKTDALQHVFYVVEQVGCYMLWDIMRRSIVIPSAFEFAAERLRCGSLEATLISIRALDEFLSNGARKAKPRSTDMVAKDWGYAGDHSFLAVADRSDINAYLAHLTWHRTAQTKAWRLPKMQFDAIKAACGFLDHVIDRFLTDGTPEMKQARALRAALGENITLLPQIFRL